MKESDVRLKVKHALRARSYWPVTQTDLFICRKCNTKNHPASGRPDILCLNTSAPSIVVEVKVVRPNETAFQFSHISEDQRKWLNNWMADGGDGYIALGVIRQHGKVQRLDGLYLVDWNEWLEMERLFATIHRVSIPVCADRARNSVIREKRLDIPTLLEPWEMKKVNGIYRPMWGDMEE